MLSLTEQDINLIRVSLIIRLSRTKGTDSSLAAEIKLLLHKLWCMRRDARVLAQG